MTKWRPEGWIGEIPFEELRKINPRLVSMMTIKEEKIYEAGADAMLEALRKRAVPSNPEKEYPGVLMAYTCPYDIRGVARWAKEKHWKLVFIPDEK